MKLSLPVTWGAVAKDAAAILLKLVGGWRAAVFLAAAIGFAMTSHHYHTKVDQLQAAAAKAKVEMVVTDQKLKVAQGRVTEKVVTKYVDRLKVVHDRGATIVKQVPIYVPIDSPDLPAGFRVYFDAAAKGILPDPTRIADASPVSAQDVATITAEDFAICHENAEQLIGIQNWIKGQQKVK